MGLQITKGKINPGIYKMTGTKWEEVEKRGGTDQVYLTMQLEDTGGTDHELRMFARQVTDQYNEGDTVTVKNGLMIKQGGKNTDDVNIPGKMGAGVFLQSLVDHGFSPSKANKASYEPQGLDGQWIKIDVVTTGKTWTDDKTGQEVPYTNVIVVELLDESDVKASGKSSSSKKGTGTGTATSSKKTSKPAVEEEEESDTEADEADANSDDDLDASDDEISAAQTFVQELIADPSEFVKNYDDESSGVTLKQANTAVFSKFKGKGTLKAKVASLVGNPKFHDQHADGWAFDEDEGVISAPPPPKKKTGTKK